MIPHRRFYRETIAIAQGNRCFWCVQKMKLRLKSSAHQRGATLEHLIPASQGGEDTPHNLVVACHQCNQKRGDKMINPVTGLPFMVVGGAVVYAPPTAPKPTPLNTPKGVAVLSGVKMLQRMLPLIMGRTPVRTRAMARAFASFHLHALGSESSHIVDADVRKIILFGENTSN